MSVNITGNNIFIKPYEQYELKTYAQNNADNPLLSFSANTDTLQRGTQDYQETETLDISSLREDLEKAKSEQGILGKLWDGFKNLTGIGAGSSKAQQAIEDYENGLITAEEMQKAVDGYKEGQKMAVDVVADMASGMISIVAFGAATAVLGPIGALLIAGAVGAASKVGIKASDAAIGGREYSGKDLLYDGITGGINGLLGPITNGIGNTVTKTIATKFGLTVLKEGAEEVAEQGLKQGFKQFAKNVVLNQSDDIIGGTLKQRMIALGAGMASDGALGGASDNMVRAALEGEDILKAGAEGFVGGLIMAPIIGGGMKLAGKGAKALNNKITTSRVLPDGMATNFRQGATGDCALLSTIDGMMANPNTANKIKNSITRTVFGDYDVKIGDRVIRVSKNALSDEILSDTTGIKIFEVAYKQMGGSIDGEFAEVVAKQFGLNPVHITSESITDELLERISKDSDNLVLSLGIDGHYYSIQGIDPQTKMVTLVDPYDTSKTLKMSFDEVKAKGVSIDGGSIVETDLANTTRFQDELFYGQNRYTTKTAIEIAEEKFKIQGCDSNDVLIQKLKSSGRITKKDMKALNDIYNTEKQELALKLMLISDFEIAGVNACKMSEYGPDTVGVIAKIIDDNSVSLQSINLLMRYVKEPEDISAIAEIITGLKANTSSKEDDIVAYMEKLLKDQQLANLKFNIPDFAEYIKIFDFDSLKTEFPVFQKYTAENWINFLNYYVGSKKTTFVAANLTMNLTGYLKSRFLDADKLSQFLDVFPLSSKIVGEVPIDWLSKTIDIDEQKLLIDKVITEFAMQESAITELGSEATEANINKFISSLASILDKKVEISTIGKGKLGKTFKISVEGSEDVCLKVFFNEPLMNTDPNIHGARIEPQTALFANQHSNDFVKMYMGRVASQSEPIAYMLTQFLDDNAIIKPTHLTNAGQYKFTPIDDHPGNYYLTSDGRKIFFDLGAINIDLVDGKKNKHIHLIKE